MYCSKTWSHFFPHRKTWNGRKNQFANVKMFDMGKLLPFELPLAIFIFVQMATKISMSNDILFLRLQMGIFYHFKHCHNRKNHIWYKKYQNCITYLFKSRKCDAIATWKPPWNGHNFWPKCNFQVPRLTSALNQGEIWHQHPAEMQPYKNDNNQSIHIGVKPFFR